MVAVAEKPWSVLGGPFVCPEGDSAWRLPGGLFVCFLAQTGVEYAPFTL